MAAGRRRRVTVAGWIGQVIAWFVIAGVLGVLAVAVLVPRLAGATPYTVLTSSMEPGMPPGTLVVVRPVEVSQIGLGDVVTFQLVSGEPEVVTHRVVGVGVTASGDRVFTTQGDANEIPDENRVLPTQIKGERWYSVPQLGRLTNLVTDHQRGVATVVVATGLFVYAGAMFLGSARDRRSSRKEHVT